MVFADIKYYLHDVSLVLVSLWMQKIQGKHDRFFLTFPHDNEIGLNQGTDLVLNLFKAFWNKYWKTFD